MSTKTPSLNLADLKPRITVIGVGGAGCNAINNMISAGLTGVDFVVANTDAQALAASSAEFRLQLGQRLTEGLGAGSRPEIGEAAAQEAMEDIKAQITGSHMVFVAAGMGGGTGTGAAGVIARAAKELGILTVGVVTKPFLFEGARRMRIAEHGINEIRKYVDTLIVIPNQNLFRVANEKTTFEEAFILADQVLYSGVACIVDLIVKDGLINLDFADVRTIMSGMGDAMMGTGEASGERRAIIAAEEAISNPLLDDVTLKGARGLLLSIIGSHNLTLYEVHEAADRVREEVDPEANIIVGATFDETLGDRVRVSIVASGMNGVVNWREPPAFGSQAGQGSQASTQRTGGASTPPPIPRQAGPDQDVHRKLSEALQQARDEPTIPMRGPPPIPGYPAEHQGGREQWQAPGDVLIESGLPDLGAHRSQPPRMTDLLEPVLGEAPFVPGAPADVRRRRMPGIEEFPAVGQREYHAKKGAAGGGNTDRRGGEAQRRVGLFERITGRRRRDERTVTDSPASNANHSSTPGDWNAPQRSVHNVTIGEDSPPETGPELPAFFTNKRR